MAVKRIPTAAKRYAKAAFDLAIESGAQSRLFDDMQTLGGMIASSDDLRVVLASPRVGREEAESMLAALAKKAKIDDIMTNSVVLMARKGRKDMVPAMLSALDVLFAVHAGQVTAAITSAQSLSAKQSESLKKTLQDMAGQTVTIEENVDETILGGLVVRVGSTLIDDSVSGKLDRLKRKLVA